MFTIKHQLMIKSSPEKVFAIIAEGKGLNLWWTLASSGQFKLNEEITLDFGPGYIWKAKIIAFTKNQFIEYQIIESTEDWKNTIVSLELIATKTDTILRFHHKNWKDDREHFQSSSYCWAVYLRLIKKYLEKGITVNYENRLDV